ncbi:regulator of G-protein signaling 12 isoform X4 [Pipistrellus kuhlii]|uniref:regulator of G-protein signaling 12 isoform X4 n=1 Tax=Pipistrellus kuhlii TaxID=59472 RepID=UPI001E274B92|nr:regulator of G-protein signaling 12 isoform X4 [Pipistrellus kuhlii]
MYRAGDTVERPPPGTAPPRLRSVEVARGRAGYGFTLSGQAPCVLSCVMRGSPADFVGLRAGDQILAINDINVRKASHEDVVKLIGKCSGVLHMVVGEGLSHLESCSSDEEVGFYDGRGWRKPRLDSKALGINRAERVVEDMQSGGIFSMIFESPRLHASSSEPSKLKQRSLSESAAAPLDLGQEGVGEPQPGLLSKEISHAVNDDSAFSLGLENQEEFGLDASILNVAMVVGYLGSIELPSTSCSLEADSFQAIRGCLRRLRAEQKIHSLVTMKVMHDGVQLCTDKAAVLAEYPAEKLAFSAVCPDDRRFFGLVTMQSSDDGSLVREGEGVLRTSCHVFMVDPDLFSHKVHQGIARRFGFECTADPDTNGCLEFPASSLPVLQFISVLYRDMGELIEGVRARAFADGDADAHQNTSTSSNSDSGIGNFNQEERSSRVLVVDLGASSSRHGPSSSTWEGAAGKGSQPWGTPWNGAFNHDPEAGPPFEAAPQADRGWDFSKHLGPASHVEAPPAPLRSSVPPSKRGAGGPGGGFGQRWLPVHVLQEWQCGHASDQESYTDSTDGWSSINCGTLPPPMNKIPADRYRLEGSLAQPLLSTQKRDWSRKAFGMQNIFGPHRNARKTKEDKKGSKFGRGLGLAQTSQRASARRSFGRSKRFSVTRSLDDLESATVSDGELNGADLKDCVSNHSLSSNASLPSVQSCRRLRERRVASWAVSFERLLQDPLGVRYFSDFLRKEFSEENILFWQACEYFSHVPAHDKKELSYRAREIFSTFLCSKATTPVNIDSQAQLADDILSAPHPDMFKEQQLQIFNLMKFDSYTRFLKSPLYQECILAEVEGRSLPDSQQVPSSPASKHSVSSDHSNVSTPKKADGEIAIRTVPERRPGRGQRTEAEGRVFLLVQDQEHRAVPEEEGPRGPRTRRPACQRRPGPPGVAGLRVLRREPGPEWREGAPGPRCPHIEPGWTAGHLGGEGPLQRERQTERNAAQTDRRGQLQLQKSLGYAFFELISKAQSNRADDQRGLLRKEDLVLPDFLRAPPGAPEPGPPGPERASRPREHAASPATSPGPADSPPFCTSTTSTTPTTPAPHVQEAEAGGVQTLEGEHVADLMLTGEGDMSSPSSTLLPPPPAPQDPAGPPAPGGRAHSSRGLPVNTIIDVDLVAGSAPGPGCRAPGVWMGPRRPQASRPPAPDLPAKPKASPHHATFV